MDVKGKKEQKNQIRILQFWIKPDRFERWWICGETHSCPLKTSCVSSAIFHTRTVRSRPPAVTHRSRPRQSKPVIASWCPNLKSGEINNTACLVHVRTGGGHYNTLKIKPEECACVRALAHTVFLHKRSHPRSTLWLSDRERRCTAHVFLSWTPNPEKLNK